VPTLWSAKLFQELDKAHVLVPLCNRDYEGEIRGFGDTVKINAIGDITVGNYAPNVTSITPEQLSAAQTNLTIDQSKYFSFYIDDIDKAQTKPKVMGEAMRKAAYALADTADQLIAGFYTQSGTTALFLSSTAITVATTLDVLALAAWGLDKKNVPRNGRWMVIPPWFHAYLVLNKLLESEGSVTADEAYGAGYVGKVFGFDMYMSNNLTTSNAANTVNSHYGLAGTNRAISFAEQIVEMEAFRPEAKFADAVKGLHVYGAKVIDPNALVTLNITSTALSS
jgi:hypothetical protein